MTTNDPSPGPYRVKHGQEIVDATGRNIAVVSDSTPTARLLAASWKLREALRDITALRPWMGHGPSATLESAQTIARDALAKLEEKP